MAFRKCENMKHYPRKHNGGCFVKITSSRTPQMRFNVWASRMFGLNIKYVDVYIDEKNNEILISPNDEYGQYSFVAPKGLDNRIVAIDSIMTRNPDIDTNQRYRVVKCAEGMKFKFERIPDYRCKGGEC